MLSEGSVAVATRCGRLQATRDAAESLWRQSKRDQGGAGGGGRYAVEGMEGTHRDAAPHTPPPTKTTAWIVVTARQNTLKTATEPTQAAS